MRLKTIFRALILTFAVYLIPISDANIAIVSNDSVRIDAITRDEAIQIFTGRITTWPNGQTITVFILPRDHSIAREFVFDWLQTTPYQFYETITINATRKKHNVIKVCCENEVIKQVIRTPGSIGVTSEFIYTNYNSEVKRIQIRR